MRISTRVILVAILVVTLLSETKSASYEAPTVWDGCGSLTPADGFWKTTSFASISVSRSMSPAGTGSIMLTGSSRVQENVLFRAPTSALDGTWDLSNISQVKVWLRTSRSMTVTFTIVTREPDGSAWNDRDIRSVTVGTIWNLYTFDISVGKDGKPVSAASLRWTGQLDFYLTNNYRTGNLYVGGIQLVTSSGKMTTTQLRVTNKVIVAASNTVAVASNWLSLPIFPVLPPVPSSPVAGWDFECHTNTHPYLTQLPNDQIAAQFANVNAAFLAHGYPAPEHTAYPYGDYNTAVEAIASQYRLSARSAFPDNMSSFPVANWYELAAMELKSATSWATIQGWVDDCVANNMLLTLYMHGVYDNPASHDGVYDITPATLTQLLDYLVQKQNAGQLTVMTVAQAYDVWNTTAKEGNAPKATVVVSFDDAHDTDYTTVYPMFKARGLWGTSYITTSAIDNWADYLTWDEIAQMRAGS